MRNGVRKVGERGMYQPACLERGVEWMRGVWRHGLGRMPLLVAILSTEC